MPEYLVQEETGGQEASWRGEAAGEDVSYVTEQEEQESVTVYEVLDQEEEEAGQELEYLENEGEVIEDELIHIEEEVEEEEGLEEAEEEEEMVFADSEVEGEVCEQVIYVTEEGVPMEGEVTFMQVEVM